MLFAGCGGPRAGTPEEQIGAALRLAEAAAEQRDISTLKDMVAE